MNWNGIVVLASTLLLFSTLSGTGPGRTSQAEEAKGPGDFETRVFEELNLARTNPDQYAEFARELRERYDGLYIKRPDEPTIITNEGMVSRTGGTGTISSTPTCA
ncbi:MAG: hypothetical protein U9R74_10980 [Pseudomonadota bacterium]|nr:hypothetical protein [Pseudomonadota bacterium]